MGEILTFKYSEQSLANIINRIIEANHSLALRSFEGSFFGAFTTSPALGAVSAQYGSYLSGHPGSLAVATAAAVSNVEWLHDAMVPLIKALESQEISSAEAFNRIMQADGAGENAGVYAMPPRVEKPVLDFAYVPPVAAIEATTPLKALTLMFAGDDSGIIAASESWRAAARRMTQAAESLQSATSLLDATTEGAAFRTAAQAIATVSAQCAVVSANSEAMAASMLQLPPIRATAHAKLLAMEAELAAESAVAGAATGGAGAAAAVARSQAQVAAFVSGYLQPALDTARPVVTNLTVPVISHTGGGVLDTAGSATMAANQAITQVAGGAAAPSAAQAAAQPGQIAQQAGQVGTTPSGAAQASPVNAATTAPAGTGTTAPGAGTAAGSPSTLAAGQRSAAALNPGGPAALRPAVSTPAGAGGAGGVQRGPGGVTQPLLPRAVSNGRAGSTAAGSSGQPGFGGTTGHGAAQSSPGVRGGSVGSTGAANGSASPAAGGRAAAPAHGMAGTPMVGGAGGAHANRTGQQKASAPVFSTGQSRQRKSVGDVANYFKRQFLGTGAKTVKKVIQ